MPLPIPEPPNFTHAAEIKRLVRCAVDMSADDLNRVSEASRLHGGADWLSDAVLPSQKLSDDAPLLMPYLRRALMTQLANRSASYVNEVADTIYPAAAVLLVGGVPTESSETPASVRARRILRPFDGRLSDV